MHGPAPSYHWKNNVRHIPARAHGSSNRNLVFIPKTQPKMFIYNRHKNCAHLPTQKSESLSHSQQISDSGTVSNRIWQPCVASAVPILSDPLLSTSLASLPIQRKIWRERRKTEHLPSCTFRASRLYLLIQQVGQRGPFHWSNRNRGVDLEE